MKLYIVEYQECDSDGKSLWGKDEWGWMGYAVSKEEAEKIIEEQEEYTYVIFRIIEKEIED